jgi:predicted GH43/DUF377 family glycosyl hydrolase
MAGQAAQSKGLALFPRRIDGSDASLPRWDRENLSVAYSDDCWIWEDSTMLLAPVLTPTAGGRDGYVPNVVYTCGALLNDGVLTIQHGISDGAIGFAQIELDELLAQMVPEPR